MSRSLTDTLCTRCGLCCDGTLLADVELAGRAEVSRLEVLGLDVEDDDGAGRAVLALPCRALQGRRCSIYPHRPECCRTFECKLLQEVGRGIVGIERAQEIIADALSRIARVEALMAALGHHEERLPLRERCAEVLARSEEIARDPASRHTRAELEAEMASLDRLLRRSFLSDGRSPKTAPPPDAPESAPETSGFPGT